MSCIANCLVFLPVLLANPAHEIALDNGTSIQAVETFRYDDTIEYSVVSALESLGILLDAKYAYHFEGKTVCPSISGPVNEGLFFNSGDSLFCEWYQ